eukprot:2904468-Pyramimonas_sp.AAC.1
MDCRCRAALLAHHRGRGGSAAFRSRWRDTEATQSRANVELDCVRHGRRSRLLTAWARVRILQACNGQFFQAHWLEMRRVRPRAPRSIFHRGADRI